MEFNGRLRQLKTRKNLTQEQPAERLYVSRTTISKWESDEGHPNIESLRYISKFLSMTIDELLSGEELITLTETENRSNLEKIYNYIYGILDMMAVASISLPLHGNSVDGYVYAVNLLLFTATTPLSLVVYWSAFAVLIVIGTAKIILTHLDKETWGGIATKYSLGLTALAICFLAATRKPYITAPIFLLFVAKIVVRIKQNGTK